MQRAAVSILSNVAEGWARGKGRSYPLQVRFALGSEAELQPELEIAMRAGVISASVAGPLLQRTIEVGRMLNGLVLSVSRDHRR
jgi:four helix bundle protein